MLNAHRPARRLPPRRGGAGRRGRGPAGESTRGRVESGRETVSRRGTTPVTWQPTSSRSSIDPGSSLKGGNIPARGRAKPAQPGEAPPRGDVAKERRSPEGARSNELEPRFNSMLSASYPANRRSADVSSSASLDPASASPGHDLGRPFRADGMYRGGIPGRRSTGWAGFALPRGWYVLALQATGPPRSNRGGASHPSLSGRKAKF